MGLQWGDPGGPRSRASTGFGELLPTIPTPPSRPGGAGPGRSQARLRTPSSKGWDTLPLAARQPLTPTRALPTLGSARPSYLHIGLSRPSIGPWGGLPCPPPPSSFQLTAPALREAGAAPEVVPGDARTLSHAPCARGWTAARPPPPRGATATAPSGRPAQAQIRTVWLPGSSCADRGAPGS